MATYLVCETFSSSEIISWEGVTYTLGTDAFNDIVTAELVASQDSPDDTNEIIVFAGNYTSSLNNFQNYEGITLNVTGVKYHGDDANKATVTLKTFKNSGIATFANAAFNATSVINNAGKTITLNGATFTITATDGVVANAGTFKVTNNSTVNAVFSGAGTVSLSGRILNSSMTGSQAFVTATNTAFYGNTTLGGEGSTLNVKAGTWLMIADTGILNLDAVTGSGYLLVQKATDDNLATLKNSTINGTVYFAKDSKLVGANTIAAFTTKSNATGVSLEDGASLTAGSVTIQSGSDFTVVASSTLKAEAVSGSGTLNLIGTLDTAEGKTLTNSGNIIVSTGTVAGDVKLASTGKIVFGTLDKAANASLTGSIIDADEDTAGKTFQVLNGNVIFEKDSNVELSFRTGAGKWFMVGFTDASIDPADVAATLTVKGTVVAHDGTWIGAASAYDESFFDKKYALVVDGGSFTNTRNAFTVRASGEVVVTNGGTFTVTCDSPIRGNITVKEGSQATLARSAFYGEFDGDKGVTSTLTVNNSALTISSSPITIGHSKLYTEKDEDVKAGLKQVGDNKDDERKGAMILDKATVTGGAFDVGRTGSVSASNGTTIDVTGTINNAGAIDIVADCTTLKTTLKADAIANAATGSITIDATGYQAGTIVKVINLSQDKKLDNVTVNTGVTGAKVAYGDDGDVVIHDIDLTNLYVNSDWTGYKEGETFVAYQIGDAIKGETGKYYGINAFSTMKAATDVANFNAGATITIGKIGASELNTDIKLTTTGEYTITGGNMTDAAAPALLLNGVNTNVTINSAILTLGKVRGGKDDANKYTFDKLTISDSIIAPAAYAGSGSGWMTFYDNTLTITNSIVGAWVSKAYYQNLTAEQLTAMKNGASATTDAGLGYVPYGDNYSGQHLGLTRDLTVTNSTLTTGFFHVQDRGTATLSNTLVYVGGSLLAGYTDDVTNSNEHWGLNTSPTDYNVGGTATISFTNGTIVRNIGWGNGNAGSGLRIGGNKQAGIINVTGSQLLMDAGMNKASEDVYIYSNGALNITNGTVSGRNISNAGSFTVSGTSTIKAATLTGNAIEVAAGSTIKDSTVGGNLTWEEGTVTFKGENSISRFEDYDKVVIGKGDSLTLTGSRPTLGYGREINVTGDIEGKATETDKTTVTKSFETANGFSLYGTGTGTLNVTNAYFVSGGSGGITLKNKKGSEPGSLGTYTLTFTNSIADITSLKMNATGNDITATVTFDASVLNHNGSITNADPGSTMTFKNGSVAIATGSFKNGGVFKVLSGSKFTANSVIQYGENSGNDGAITVDGKGSVMTLVNEKNIGHAFKSVEGASITVTNGGVFSANYVTNEGTITIDTASLLTGTALDNTNGKITIDATNLDADSYVKVIDLKQSSKLTGVSVVGNSNAHAVYGADGDVVVTNISSETLYVNSAWTGINPVTEKAYEFGDVVGEGMVFGINAFSDIATMVSGITSVTNKIKFLKGGTYDLNWTAATISQSMTFETDGVKPTISNGEFNLGTKNGTGDPETYALNNDIYFFQFATNKNSPAVLTIDAELSIAQGIWFKAGTKTTVTEKGSIQRIDQFPYQGKAELQAGQFEVYGELTVNGTVNYFTQGATSYTFRIGNANEATYTGVLNVDGGNVHFMNNDHVDGNHPAYAPSLIDENGTVNLTNGGKLTVDHPLTNKGAINLNGNATFTANGGINNSGAIKLEVLPKEDEVLTETESTETEEEVAFNKFTAKSISNSGTIDAKVGSTITTESGSFTNKTGAEVTVLGDSENLASTVIDAKKGISNSGSFSVTNATINVDGDALANTTNGVLTITNSIVNVGANYAFNNWAGSTTVSATTVNATINVFDGSFTIGEGASTLNGGFSGTAKLADGAVLKDSTVTKAYGAADIGTFTIATGASVGISGKNTLTAAITNNGTITIDATSTLTATSIAGGTIELTNFADNATRPVITVNGADFTATVQWKYTVPETGVEKTYTLDGATTYTDDKKFLVQKSVSTDGTTISIVKVSGDQGTLYVNNAWKTLDPGTVVDGKIIGFNAFGDFTAAYKAGKNNAAVSTIKLVGEDTEFSTTFKGFTNDIDHKITVTADAASTLTLDMPQYQGDAATVGELVIDKNVTVNYTGKAFFVGSINDVDTIVTVYGTMIAANSLNFGEMINYAEEIQKPIGTLNVKAGGLVKVTNGDNILRGLKDKSQVNLIGDETAKAMMDTTAADTRYYGGTVTMQNAQWDAAGFTLGKCVYTYRTGIKKYGTDVAVNMSKNSVLNATSLSIGALVGADADPSVGFTASLTAEDSEINVSGGVSVLNNAEHSITGVSMSLTNSDLSAATLTNSAEITATDSNITTTGAITNNGTFSATGSTILAKATGFGFVNTETLTIDSSTVTVGGGAAILKNEGSGAKQITIRNKSTVNAGLYNYTGATVTITDSTVGTAGAYVKNWGAINATDATLKASYVENNGTYTVGGESSFAIGNLSVGSITLADDAEISASTITESAEGTSVKVLADTEATFVGTNIINAVIDNAGTLNIAAEQTRRLIDAENYLDAAAILNNGSIIGAEGVFVYANTITNNADGEIVADSLAAGTITNYGSFTVTGLTAGTITNNADGEIVADSISADEIVNSGDIAVDAIVKAEGAEVAAAITNNADGEILAGSIAAATITNYGDIDADSVSATGTIKNAGTFTVGTIEAPLSVTEITETEADEEIAAIFTADRVENSAGELTVNGKAVIANNVVVSGGKVTFNGNVTAANLNTQNASATININDATVSVAGTIYYSGTIVATNSVLDGSKFSGTGTMKVVDSSIKGITLNHGTMQLDTMSLEDVTVDGAFDVVGDSDFFGINEVEGLTVSEGANLTISAEATITSLTQPSLTVTAGDLVNHGTITIDADGLEWGSTLKQLKVVSVTGEGKKAFSDGTITVTNADDTMAIVQDDGIYLYYVKSSGETKTLFVNSAWSYAPGYEFDYDDHHLVFGMNAFQDADDIVFYANTDALVFVGGNTTPYADLDWSKDDVSVTIDGGLEAKFSDIKLGSATLTGDIRADDLTFTGDTTVSGKIFANNLTVEKTLAMDWDNPIVAATLTAGAKSITIDVSEGLQKVVTDTAVITTSSEEAIDFASIVDNYDKDIYVTDGTATTGWTLSLSAKAIGKVSKGVDENPDAGLYNSISKAVGNANTKLILIVSGDFGNASLKGKRTQVLTSGTVGNYYFAGGCNVATEPLNPESPYAELYGDYKEFKGSTNVTIENGQFSTAVVIGADIVQLATSESSVTFFHVGDSNLTINGGHFEAAKNSSTGGYGERAIAGGMYYNIASGKAGEARLFGNVNLTITGGEFIGYNVYGGNFVNGTKVLCNRTHIKGNITLTLDATTNELNFTANEGGFGGIVQAGSFGQSNVTGNSEVILKGAKGITFEYLVGGSTSDDHILKNGKWTCESYVTGTRTLTFSGFTGDLDFSKVSDFTTVAFEGTNEVNFEGEFHRYFNDDVTNWVFASTADALATLDSKSTVNFDFSGDTVNLNGFTTANVDENGWSLAGTFTDTVFKFDGQATIAAGLEFKLNDEKTLATIQLA